MFRAAKNVLNLCIVGNINFSQCIQTVRQSLICLHLVSASEPSVPKLLPTPALLASVVWLCIFYFIFSIFCKHPLKSATLDFNRWNRHHVQKIMLILLKHEERYIFITSQHVHVGCSFLYLMTCTPSTHSDHLSATTLLLDWTKHDE